MVQLAGQVDIRPCPGEGILHQPTSAFFLKNAGRVVLRNCEAAWAPGLPEEYRHALEAHQVDDLVLLDFIGEAAHPGIQAIIQD